MIEKLQAELLKVKDNLQTLEFTIGKEKFKWYFRYLTLLEKVRIEQMSIKVNQVIKSNGSTETKYELQEHLIPVHTILEKALDEDGKRLFSHTDPKHFQIISDLPAGVASSIAFQMSLDIMGTLEDKTDAE